MRTHSHLHVKNNHIRWLVAMGIILALGFIFVLSPAQAKGDLLLADTAKNGRIFFDNLKRISPDGKWLVQVSASDLGMNGSTIWISKPDGTGMKALITGGMNYWITNPVWSPDGMRIAYLKVTQAQVSRYEATPSFEIWVIGRDGSDQHQLTGSRLLNPALGYGGQTDLVWGQDNRIQFENNSIFPTGLYGVDVETGQVQFLSVRQPALINATASQPVNVPDFKQCASPWGTTMLGTCSNYTVCNSGCAMTATANVFKYYGVQTDPGALNQWLKVNGGYLNGCLIIWSVAAHISPDISFVGVANQNWSLLRSELDAGYPVIVQVMNNGGTHFVVVTGYSGNTYYINDPAYTNRTTLDSYGNKFNDMRIFHGPLNICESTEPLPADYVKCADEGGTCTFAGTGNVYYGANESYHVQTGVTGSIECSTQAFTCDPAHGTPKACYYKITDILPPTSFGKSAPVNSVQGIQDTVTLSWAANPDAASYAYCMDTTANDQCDGTWVDVGINTSVDLTGLEAGTSYFWQVKASNAGGDTYADSGAWWSFDTFETLPQVAVTAAPDAFMLEAGDSDSVEYTFNESAGGSAIIASRVYQYSTPSGMPLGIESDPVPTNFSLNPNGSITWVDTITLPADIVAAAKAKGVGSVILQTVFTGATDRGQPVKISTTVSITILHKLTVRSQGKYDGWILETGQNTALGGDLDVLSDYFYLGDNEQNLQYRSILSFFTAGLPDNATIVSATLKIRYAGASGTSLQSSHSSLLIDMRRGNFSGSRVLESTDFQAWAKLKSVTSFAPNSVKGWYLANLPTPSFQQISLKGITQFRLRFELGTNGDNIADYLTIFSGDVKPAYRRPALVVAYYVP